MTEQEATRVYFDHNKTSHKTLRRLMAWDESLTVRDNAIALGIALNLSLALKKFYGLKSKKAIRHHKWSWDGKKWIQRKVSTMKTCINISTHD